MKNDDVRPHAIGLLVGYGLQFLAGMLLNLFVTIPSKHAGSSGSNYVSQSSHSLTWTLSGAGGWELAVHVYLGLLLVIGSLSLFIRAMALHDRQWSITGALATLFTLGAFFNGLSFVDFNKDFSSMIMATCWLVAVSSIVYGLLSRSKPA
jgi:hypothetical protein